MKKVNKDKELFYGIPVERSDLDQNLILINQATYNYLMNELNQNIDFSNCHFFEVTFDNLSLYGFPFQNSRFYGCKFNGFTLTDCDFENTSITDCIFNSSIIDGCNFKNAGIYQTSFENTNLVNNSFELTSFRHSSFSDTTIKKNDFQKSKMNSVYFRNVESIDNEALDTISITMGGATTEEVANHRQQIMRSLNPVPNVLELTTEGYINIKPEQLQFGQYPEDPNWIENTRDLHQNIDTLLKSDSYAEIHIKDLNMATEDFLEKYGSQLNQQNPRPEAGNRNLLDPEEEEYHYPDNFVSEPNHTPSDDQRQPSKFFNAAVTHLAADIEDYLSTYDSPPFGYAEGIPGQQNREEWIKTISEDLVTEKSGWIRGQIDLSLASEENINSPEVHNIAQKLLSQIDDLILTNEESIEIKPGITKQLNPGRINRQKYLADLRSTALEQLEDSGTHLNTFSHDKIIPALSKIVYEQYANSPENLLENINSIEKNFYFKKYGELNPDFYNPENPNAEFYLPNSVMATSAHELTGISTREMIESYDYEDATGYFEFNYNPVRFLEGIKFGKWETEEFIGHVEKGYYAIDQNSEEYKDYQKKLLKSSLQKLCEKYPEESFHQFINEQNISALAKEIDSDNPGSYNRKLDNSIYQGPEPPAPRQQQHLDFVTNNIEVPEQQFNGFDYQSAVKEYFNSQASDKSLSIYIWEGRNYDSSQKFNLLRHENGVDVSYIDKLSLELSEDNYRYIQSAINSIEVQLQNQSPQIQEEVTTEPIASPSLLSKLRERIKNHTSNISPKEHDKGKAFSPDKASDRLAQRSISQSRPAARSQGIDR